MATPLDSILPAAALSVLNLYGVAATLVQITGGTYDPEQRVVSGGSTASTAITISPPGRVKAHRRQSGEGDVGGGGGELQEFFECFVAASGLAVIPAVNDRLTYGGVSWIVSLVEPLRSGDSLAAYRLELSR